MEGGNLWRGEALTYRPPRSQGKSAAFLRWGYGVGFSGDMTIPLTGTGGVFTRFGHEVFLLNSACSFLGSADLSAGGIASVGASVTTILAQYQAADQDVVDGIFSDLATVRTSLSSWISAARSRFQSAVIEMVDDDGPLDQKSLAKALPILIAQMVTSADTIKYNATSAAVTPGTNTGTAVCAATTKGPDGTLRQYVFNETFKLTCSSDSQSGAATAGSEPWSLVGEIPQSNPLAYNWPLGSGIATTLTAIDAGVQSYLTNADFETFTVTNTPDNWTLVAGVAGTDIFRDTGYKGSYAVRFLGDGSQHTSITQSFNQTSGGSTQRLLPSRVYAFNAFLKVSAIPSGGVLTFDLIDGGGSTITNDAGTSQTISKTLSAATTSFVALNGFFQTPSILPTSTPYKFRIRLSTALESGKSVFIDDVSFLEVQPLYTGGPYVAVFSGATASVKGDTFSVAIANDWGGKFQKAAERFFGMRTLGLQFPYATGGGQTISESLVA